MSGADAGLWRLLRSDALALREVKAGEAETPRGARSLLDVLTLPGFWCVVLWRLANHLHQRGLRVFSRLCYVANLVLFGADLAPGCQIGPGLVVPHPVGVAVARQVRLGRACRLMGLVRIGGGGDPQRSGFPVLGNDVWVLDGARLFGPIQIGDGAVIGSTCTVAQDIPADTLVLSGQRQGDLRLRPRTPVGAP